MSNWARLLVVVGIVGVLTPAHAADETFTVMSSGASTSTDSDLRAVIVQIAEGAARIPLSSTTYKGTIHVSVGGVEVFRFVGPSTIIRSLAAGPQMYDDVHEVFVGKEKVLAFTFASPSGFFVGAVCAAPAPPPMP